MIEDHIARTRLVRPLLFPLLHSPHDSIFIIILPLIEDHILK
jgi:hypothetical protein